jgi:hypothetical protein
VKWVAVIGFNKDWAVYAGKIGESLDFIKDRGEKVYNLESVRKWTEATREAMKLYRGTSFGEIEREVI